MSAVGYPNGAMFTVYPTGRDSYVTDVGHALQMIGNYPGCQIEKSVPEITHPNGHVSAGYDILRISPSIRLYCRGDWRQALADHERATKWWNRA